MKNFDVENDEIGMEIDNEFGDGSGPKQFKKNYEPINYFQYQQGDNYYRIMPEMFEAKEKGLWAVYYVRHWGYFNEKGKQQPFVCLKKFDYKTKTVLRECVFCQDQDKKQANLENLDAKIKTLRVQLQGTVQGSEEYLNLQNLVEATTKEWQKVKSVCKVPERKFWVNAMNKAGEFGLLQLPKTVYEQLAGKRDANVRLPGLIKKLQDNEGIEALNVNQGVWFNITRSGSDQFSTEYTTSIETESIEVNGRKLQQTKLAPLSNDQKLMAIKKCRDLTSIFSHLVLSDEQMSAIVNGSPAAVNAAMTTSKPVSKPTVDDNFGTRVASAIDSVKRGRVLTDEEILARLKA